MLSDLSGLCDRPRRISARRSPKCLDLWALGTITAQSERRNAVIAALARGDDNLVWRGVGGALEHIDRPRADGGGGVAENPSDRPRKGLQG